MSCTHAEHGLRVRRPAQAPAAPSAQPGDGVGTPAWSGHRGVEAHVARPCTGAALHAGNLRLSGDEFVAEYGGDQVRMLDLDQLAPVERPAATSPTGVVPAVRRVRPAASSVS